MPQLELSNCKYFEIAKKLKCLFIKTRELDSSTSLSFDISAQVNLCSVPTEGSSQNIIAFGMGAVALRRVDRTCWKTRGC